MTDKQLVNSIIQIEENMKEEDIINWKWGIKRAPSTYTHHLDKDEFVGKAAKKFLKKEDYEVSITIDNFSL